MLKQNTQNHIGVLALQGGVTEHIAHLRELGVPCTRVRQKEDFEHIQGLIIPGGESTCLKRLIENLGLKTYIQDVFRRGVPIWGTCAGAILVAKHIEGEDAYMKLADISIRRNAFGNQLASFQDEMTIPSIADEPIPLTFIRAPMIIDVGKEVQVLARREKTIFAVESAQVLVTVFHPELTQSLAFHRHFAQKCGFRTEYDGRSAQIDKQLHRMHVPDR